MPVVLLKSPAFLNYPDTKLIPNHAKNFQLYKLKADGTIGKHIEFRGPHKGQRYFFPAHVPLKFELFLPAGDYILLAGIKPKTCKFFHVSNSEIFEIPNPKPVRRVENES